MPRRSKKEPKQRQIASDDELSASGPEMSDDEEQASSEEELNETEVMRVQGRSDSEDDDEFETQQRQYAPTTSKDAFGKNEFIGTDLTEKKRRKLKRDEKREIAELEEKDADERRADLMNLIGAAGEEDEESSSDDDETDAANVATVDEGEMTKEEKIKLLKRQSPELFPLIAELKLYKGEMDNLLVPLTRIFTDEGLDFIF